MKSKQNEVLLLTLIESCCTQFPKLRSPQNLYLVEMKILFEVETLLHTIVQHNMFFYSLYQKVVIGEEQVAMDIDCFILIDMNLSSFTMNEYL